MRIIVDANIIISAGLFPESNVGKALADIAKNHKLVVCKYTLDELKNVFKKKFPDRIEYINNFIKNFKYEYIDFKVSNYKEYPQIRDVDDIPLLANAIAGKADILITGDKDFDGIKIDDLVIMKPSEYLKKYIDI